MNRALPRTAALASLLLTAGSLLWLFHYSCRGIELGDEAYYLIWMANPFAYGVSLTQFGFVYHPFYLLLNGDIALLRQLNIVITFVLGWLLTDVLLRKRTAAAPLSALERLAITSAVACGSLFMLSWLSFTLSYNTAAIHGGMIVAIGMLYAEKRLSPASAIGRFLMGLGGWLAFMGKPTSCAAAGLVAFVYLYSAKKLDKKIFISIFFFFILLIVTAFATEGSITGYIKKIIDGFDPANSVASLSNSWTLKNFKLPAIPPHIYIFCIILFIITCINCLTIKYYKKISNKLFLIEAIVFSILSLVAVFAPVFIFSTKYQAGINPYYPLISLSTILFALIVLFFRLRIHPPSIPARDGTLFVLLILFPLLLSLGTGNIIWKNAGMAVFFWIIAGLLLLLRIERDSHFTPILLFFGAFTQFIVILTISNTAIKAPFRQRTSLPDQHYQVEIGIQRAELLVSAEAGRYFAEAQEKARVAGLRPGSQMLDMTGMNPFIPYMLGAENTGRAWFMSSRKKRAEAFAEKGFSLTSCEDLASAWLLSDMDGPFALPPRVLSSFGARIGNYEVAANWEAPPVNSYYREMTTQQLLRPIRPFEEAVRACEQTRSRKQR